VRIIKIKTIRDYGLVDIKHQGSLEEFIKVLKMAIWDKPSDAIKTFGIQRTDTFKNNRVCINIAGNNIRCVLAVDYRSKICLVKWIGSHSDYNQIDPKTVEYKG
jgi:mRNA interferase HigB